VSGLSKRHHHLARAALCQQCKAANVQGIGMLVHSGQQLAGQAFSLRRRRLWMAASAWRKMSSTAAAVRPWPAILRRSFMARPSPLPDAVG
jgi:hypothetical protein